MDLPALREKLRECQRKAAATDEVAAKKAYLLVAETWQSMIRVEENLQKDRDSAALSIFPRRAS